MCVSLKLTRAGLSLAALCLSSFAVAVFASSLRNRGVAMADASDQPFPTCHWARRPGGPQTPTTILTNYTHRNSMLAPLDPLFPLAPQRILTGTKKTFSIPLRSHFPKLHLRVWIEGPEHVLLVSSHDLPLCCVPLPQVTVHWVHSDQGDQPSSLSIAGPQNRHKVW